METLTTIDALNRQRAATPFDPVVARRWCAEALRRGQAHKVQTYAASLYARESVPLRRTEWSRLGGAAAFRQLKLEQALAAFTVSIGHLCEIGERGRAPGPSPRQEPDVAFANGQAEDLLWATSVALTRAGLAPFPYAGTLLGLVREGQLLHADKDIDLGIWAEDFDTCCSWLESHGWLPIRDLPPYKTFRAFLHPASRLTLDIVGLQRLPAENTVRGGFYLEGHPPQYQSPRILPWIELQIRATPAGDAWVVKEPETLLTALYGDWRTPNPWWDGMVSCLGITEFTLLVRCYAYDRLLARWTSGQIDRAWAYTHQILLQDATDLPALRANQCLAKLLDASSPGATVWPPKPAGSATSRRSFAMRPGGPRA